MLNVESPSCVLARSSRHGTHYRIVNNITAWSLDNIFSYLDISMSAYIRIYLAYPTVEDQKYSDEKKIYKIQVTSYRYPPF